MWLRYTNEGINVRFLTCYKGDMFRNARSLRREGDDCGYSAIEITEDFR